MEQFQEAFKNAGDHTIVVFTHRDKLSLELEEIIENNESLKKFINESSKGYIVLNNTVRDDAQVTNLLQKIITVVQENERMYYSNKMFEAAVEAFNKVMQCPDVKSEMERKETPLSKLMTWLQKGVAAVKQEDLLRCVEFFLKWLQKVALECMPNE